MPSQAKLSICRCQIAVTNYLARTRTGAFLRDRALRQDFWDPIKYIRLRRGRDDWYLSIGGEAREVWEQIGNDNWGQQSYMNGYFNERYMIHFDVHYGKHFERSLN